MKAKDLKPGMTAFLPYFGKLRKARIHSAVTHLDSIVVSYKVDGKINTCVMKPESEYEVTNPIVTIAARNMQPGYTYIMKISGPCPRTHEHPVVKVEKQETPDWVFIKVTYQDNRTIGQVYQTLSFEPNDPIKVRKNKT